MIKKLRGLLLIIFSTTFILYGCASVTTTSDSAQTISARTLRLDASDIRFSAFANYGLKTHRNQYARIVSGIYVQTKDKVILLSQVDGIWVEFFGFSLKELSGVGLLAHGMFNHVHQLQVGVPDGTLAAHVRPTQAGLISAKSESEASYKALVDAGIVARPALPLIEHPPPGGGASPIPIFIPKR